VAFPLMPRRVAYSVVAFLLFGVACAPVFKPQDEAAIRQVMADQEKAWDAGDIDGFMRGYADSICFTGRKGLTCGKSKVTANYKEHYPDRAAMGDLTFGITEVKPIAADNAWLTGTWRLIRATDTLGGGFTLLWQRTPEGWRIIRDHSY
jgi:ketosteroid isomerase-like protein